MLRWGLVPGWARDDKGGAAMINAKAETVSDKAAYRAAFKARPCLVVADGFYEWAKADDNAKQPYFITTKNKTPFALAGLWERWRATDAPGETPALDTFTILTTGPNTTCAPIHDRIPVILAQEDWAKWLATPEDRKSLLRAFPSELMECWPVGKAVGNVRNEGEALIARIQP